AQKPHTEPKAQAAPTPSTSAPANGARVTSPPLLRWRKVGGADYYNVQLFHGGSKVLSIWPTTNRLRLSGRWVYAGRAMTLRPGAYVWYVWPGFGPLARARYGNLILRSTFVVAPA